MAVFVLGENMVVHGSCAEVCGGRYFGKSVLCGTDFVEGGVVNFKEQGFKDF